MILKNEWIKEVIEQRICILKSTAMNDYLTVLETVGTELLEILKKGNKILLAGNGGSAADAQHFAGEIIGRFTMERDAFAAVSLCTDPSVVTCIANDYGYEEVFARQLDGLGKEGDIFILFSTSGNSPNLVRAAQLARKKRIKIVGFLGKDGGKLRVMCDYALVVPAESTPEIQEIHTLSVHLLCRMIDEGMAV